MNPEQDKKQSLETLRHSTAHLLAHAAIELYPQTKLTIGPPTADGFFYDFLPAVNFKEEDLPVLEKRMHEIARRNLPLTHEQMPKEQARKLFQDNPFKLELIDGIPGDTVGIARQGDFVDLCKGGHVANTNELKHFKLQSISGSYWRADRENQPLQRITGTAFWTAEDLAHYEQLREQAMLYDHRRVGKQLDLFSFNDEGVGFPFFHPKGKLVFNLLVEYMRRVQRQAGYQEISTPIMLSDTLWRQSGHYAHYRDNMYFAPIDEHQYAVKPMNCPGAILVYKSNLRSFRDLPLPLAEFGLVHRHELSGVLHGLFRVRAFTQDDAHIFCTVDQLEAQITNTLNLTLHVLKTFGFEKVKIAVSTKPANAMGDDALWVKATDALTNALDAAHAPFTIQAGEGAFYGPKIEFKIKDSMEREWQCGTIQVDFFQPQNFDLSYTASGGHQERPVMIHQVIFGSLERFIGILLEHHKGLLPFWLAPVQVAVLTITDHQLPYAQEVASALRADGLRVFVDESSDKISGKIKAAQLKKVPWMLVLGNKEMEQKTITLRHYDGTQEPDLTIDALMKKSQELIAPFTQALPT